MINNSDLACRVCGRIQAEPPWGENGRSPNYALCACCGVEFGYEDGSINSTKKFREEWLSSGAKWWQPQKKPADWSLEEQMKNIPEKYK